MDAKNQEPLLTAIKDFELFAKQLGAEAEAAKLNKLAVRLQTEGLDRKQRDSIEEDICTARGLAFFKTTQLISRSARPDAEKKQLDAEAVRLKEALTDALLPPKVLKFQEAQVQGLAGNKELTTVRGDAALAPEIAEQALVVVRQFSTAVFRQDLEAAYALLANETRTWMGVKRFFTELNKADEQYDGKAVDCVVERINFIYSGEAARLTPNSHADFPKDTPKTNKRAVVGTFWLTKPAEQTGRWVAFWVTEEVEGYRIAKFSQYLQ